MDNHLHKFENVLVSIIVCSRNEEKYIEECINSLTNQKRIAGEFEIIVVDGISEDRTREILNKLSDKGRVMLLIAILYYKTMVTGFNRPGYLSCLCAFSYANKGLFNRLWNI